MIPNRVAINKALCKWESGLSGLGKLLASSDQSAAYAQPIFVIGTGRCGSTLFSRVLESHDELLIYPTEGNNLFFPHSYPYSAKTIDTPAILENPGQYTELSVDAWPDDQQERLRNTFRGFQMLNGKGKQLLIKSAMISFLVPRLLDIFPDAKFIHLYRDGLSVVASIVKKEWHKYAGHTTSDAFLVWAAQYWNECILQIHKVDQELSLTAQDKLLELSYEQFCEDPKAIAVNLAAFIGCAPDRFSFDFSTIQSTNYKAQTLNPDDCDRISALIDPGMRLKGYRPS